MSSACTCHVDPKQCWWCLYEAEKAKVQRYEKAIVSAYKLASAEGYCGVCDELSKAINAYNIDVWEGKE